MRFWSQSPVPAFELGRTGFRLGRSQTKAFEHEDEHEHEHDYLVGEERRRSLDHRLIPQDPPMAGCVGRH
jgi:hypothetical protein